MVGTKSKLYGTLAPGERFLDSGEWHIATHEHGMILGMRVDDQRDPTGPSSHRAGVALAYSRVVNVL